MTKRYQHYLILIVVVLAVAIWISLPNHPGIRLGFLGIEKDIETRLGLDLVGGVQALLEADLPAETAVTPEQMSTATRIIENRVNGLGVSESVVQQAGDRRIVVELPGEKDPEKALATLRQTSLLEFVDFAGLTPAEIEVAVENPIITDSDSSATGGSAPSSGEPSASDTLTSTAQTVTPRVFRTVMTGAALKTARVERDPTTGEVQIAFELQPDGAAIFKDYTTNNVGEILAIVLDKRVISYPQIRNPIPDGQGVISGGFTLEEANALANNLRYGALPVPLRIIESRVVGPSLGEDSLNKSLVAGAVGFSVVILFMVLYYRLPGVLAAIAILIYAVLAYALFRYIPVTLTLPGIAGFLLSTGSALDANILIFERLKEELRAGRTLQQAIDLGWQRAWPSIRDSNVATLITCAILFWFGSAFGATIVKGFSLTLAFGVAVSLFTAIVVTRTLFSLVITFFKPENKARWFGI